MLQTQLRSEVKTLIMQLMAADVVKIDDQLYTFIAKTDLDVEKLSANSKEDHQHIFETEFHVFNWWEIVNESKKINDREWQIGVNVMSFYSIQPL